MKKASFFILLTIAIVSLYSCSDDDVRNIAANPGGSTNPNNPGQVTEVNPVDITVDGYDFMEKMQGQWVGTNRVITTDYPFFAWDYRAISSSHTFGIHEGGSAGNLFTSFFVTNFKGKRTIMARNGGLLSGIYRTSYFVMDKVENRSNGKYYRLVDALGGDGIMYMELLFPNNTDSLYFNAYTSGLGNRPPTRHMTFKAKRNITDLAQIAATTTSYPENIVNEGLDFVDGFNTNYLYVEDGATEAKSATFLAQQNENNVFTLAVESGDPFIITQHPRLGYLQIDIERGNIADSQTLLLYLSKEALTDEYGYFTSNLDAYDSILHFPVLTEGENQFLMTYMHPGTYYVTIVADMDGDFSPSEGDITHTSQMITLNPLGEQQITISNINVQN